jgi:hypothetical protein
VEWDFRGSPFRDFLKQDVYHGHGGLRSFIRERTEDAWRDIEDQLEELIDTGEHVVSVVLTRGRGLASGAEVEMTHAGGLDATRGHDRPGCVGWHAWRGARIRRGTGAGIVSLGRSG